MKHPQAANGTVQQILRKRMLDRWSEAVLPPEAAMLAGQRVLLSGTSGQLGGWLLRQLLKADARIDALSFRTQIEFTHPNLRWHAADLTAPDALAPLAAEHGLPPALIFCAPLWFLPPQMEALAAGGVRRIIAFSSTSMHVKADSAHPAERALVARLRDSEAALFAWAAKTGIALTILRPTMIYGLGLDANVGAIARMLRRTAVFPVACNAHGLRQPVHTDDLARAVFACLARPEATTGQAYDLSGGEVLTYRALVARIAALPGVGGMALPVPFLALCLDIAGKILGKRDKIHGEIARRMQQDLAFSHDAATADFGYAPRAFLDAALQPEGIPFV